MVVEKLLEAEAAKRGLADVAALIKVEVEDKTTPATEAEIEQFYTMMARRLQGKPLAEVRDVVVGELNRRKQGELAQKFIEGLRTQANTKNTLPMPEVPRIQVSADDDPFIGPVDAPITIIQFAEFQCPYCGKAGESIDQVMKEYDGKIKMVYRDFPLGFHDRAIPAAVAANCAGEQDKYWEMHKLLMNNQRALDESTLISHATSLELDMSKWEICRKDDTQVEEVKKDMADGAAVGVTGTPAFFINGVMLSGAQPFSEFKAIIDRELNKG